MKEFIYLPAYPGFHTVELNCMDSVLKRAIIGWELVQEQSADSKRISTVYPITSEGVNANSASAVLYPDGQVSAFDGDFKTESEWYKYELRKKEEDERDARDSRSPSPAEVKETQKKKEG